MMRAASLTLALLAVLACAAGHAMPPSPAIDTEAEFYFANLVTGATQWADPGDCPYIDGDGNRYWRDPTGQWTKEDPNAWKYKWVERWSQEHSRPFFFNQHTKVSIWNRPADLAWVRVGVTEANRHKAPQRPYIPGQHPPSAIEAATKANFSVVA